MDTPSLNLKDRTRWPSASNGCGKKAYQFDHINDISGNASGMSILLPKPSNESVPTAPITLGKSRRRTRAKIHHCSLCDKSFTSPSRLLDHQFSHTGESPHSCQQCDKKFHSKSQLTRHNLTHRTARAFACFKCGKSFYRKDHLSNHVRVHDPVRRLLVCEHEGCGKHYSSTLSFRKHSAIHAAEGGQLDCTICGAAFTDKTKLLEHLRTHMGKRCVQNEKKFQCENCDLTFFTAKDARRHQVVHTGRRDFACVHCPQKFGRKDHLVRHVKNTHTDWPRAPKLLKPPQVVVVKTEDKPKLESLTYLGLKFSPSISENCVKLLKSNTGKKNKSSVQSVKTSTGTLLFLEVPIEIDTVIKKEPLSDVEELDSSNLNKMNIKTEIVI